MRHDERRPAVRSRRKRPILVVLFSLLPLLISVGILAPGMIHVMAVEGDQIDPPSVRITRRLSRYAHQPLLLPRDFSAGFIPELLDLEHLFSRVEYMGDPMTRERARLPSFPRDFGDVIVLDDVDQRIREIVFKDPVVTDSAFRRGPRPVSDFGSRWSVSDSGSRLAESGPSDSCLSEPRPGPVLLRLSLGFGVAKPSRNRMVLLASARTSCGEPGSTSIFPVFWRGGPGTTARTFIAVRDRSSSRVGASSGALPFPAIRTMVGRCRHSRQHRFLWAETRLAPTPSAARMRLSP